MEYGIFKNKLFEKAGEFGFSDYEAYYTENSSFMLRIFGGEISEYKNTDAVGLSFRGTYQGRVGYAYTEKIDESVIGDLIKNAAANSQVIEEKEIEKLYPGDAAYPEAVTYNPVLETVTAGEKIKIALAMEKFAYTLDERVKSVDYCMLSTADGTTAIANSYGMGLSERSNLAAAYIGVRVTENGVTKTGFNYWHGNDFAAFSYELLAKEAVRRAVASLSAASVPSGDYPIMFNNEAACDFFFAYAGVYYAEQAQKGFSLLGDKVGKEVAAALVTIRDDGICDKSFGSVSFDSEGVATRNKTVIENGVLKTLLYNTKSAEKDGVKSTGNGFRAGFRASVGTACTNFYMLPSDKTPEEIMSGMESGLFITELQGLHAGANTISGDFSLSATGFMIENGTVSRPVEQITIAGNYFELLKNIDAVGNDLRFDIPSGAGAFGMPSLLVHGLRVSGL